MMLCITNQEHTNQLLNVMSTSLRSLKKAEIVQDISCSITCGHQTPTEVEKCAPLERIAGSEVEKWAPLERNGVGSHARAMQGMQGTRAGGVGPLKEVNKRPELSQFGSSLTVSRRYLHAVV